MQEEYYGYGVMRNEIDAMGEQGVLVGAVKIHVKVGRR
jgi:hypothetical protein